MTIHQVMQEWPAAEKEGQMDAEVREERQKVLKGRPLVEPFGSCLTRR
jgi:hypothetical protein